MDLSRIERFIGALRRIKDAKFSSDNSSVTFSKLEYLTEDFTRELGNKLNRAIGGIIEGLNRELKKELALREGLDFCPCRVAIWWGFLEGL